MCHNSRSSTSSAALSWPISLLAACRNLMILHEWRLSKYLCTFRFHSLVINSVDLLKSSFVSLGDRSLCNLRTLICRSSIFLFQLAAPSIQYTWHCWTVKCLYPYFFFHSRKSYCQFQYICTNHFWISRSQIYCSIFSRSFFLTF